MDPMDDAPVRSRDALLRESKDHIAIGVIELCRRLHIRALVGGGPVLTAHGLISPGVASNASIVVDPASIRHLYSALCEEGWRLVEERRPRILPSARLALAHDDELAGLMLYSVIPGFFADPEESFDLLWERHKELPLRGHTVRVLGRVASALLASHDGLDGRASRQRSNFDYFVPQFRRLLGPKERIAAVELVRKLGACGEMSELLTALDVEPCEFMLPSLGYVQVRLQVSEASEQVRRAVALIDLPPAGRALMYKSRNGRPQSIRDVWTSIRSLPRTCVAIFGASRRWRASFG
jgi:hypothetical protein